MFTLFCIFLHILGALINMTRAWGVDYDAVKNEIFNDLNDRVFSFSSDKKRFFVVIIL